MKIDGSHLFAATPEQVWQAICDPLVLKACIPQCEEVVRLSDTQWQGKAKVGLGMMKVRFVGDITLSDLNPPHSYRIHILAKGWVGSATGHSLVTLTPEENSTRLTYNAEVHLGIKLLDSAMNLADRVAKELAESFFTRLGAKIVERHATP